MIAGRSAWALFGCSPGAWFARGAACIAFAIMATAAPASVFYNVNVIAESGTAGFLSFGNGPSINDKGKVAFIGRVSGGETAFMYSPLGGVTNIAPGFISSNRSFGEGVQINDRDEVGTWNRRLAAVSTYEMRLFRSATPDDNTVMVRAATGSAPYELLYPFPTINNNALLEDRSAAGGNLNGVCDPGELCVPQTAFATFTSTAPLRHLVTVVNVPQFAADPGVYDEFGFNGTIARPMLADDGRFVVRGRNPTDAITLFEDHTMTLRTQIAGASTGFTALGNAPGITDDGKVVAFAGNRGNGDGIFLSMETPSGRKVFRIAGENALVTRPELGFNGTGELYINSVDLDSRVGIIYTPDAQGSARGAIVVSFIGTPNAASRINPGSSKPFLFSANKGLWTLRIELTAPRYLDTCLVHFQGVAALPAPGGDDAPGASGKTITAGTNGVCETENSFNHEVLFARTSPVPVVQVGDVVKNGSTIHTLTDIAVHDPLAAATHDGALVARSMRRGDHRVVFWAAAGASQLIVAAEHLDSDQDGLMDHWETTGVDIDLDGIVDLDLAGMGANPFQRDIFMQLDWSVDRGQPLNPQRLHEPSPGLIRQLAQFLAAAPALANGIPAGITLHVDAGTGQDKAMQFFSRNMGIGPLRGGNPVSASGQAIDLLHQSQPGSIAFPGVAITDMDTLKVNHFWSHHRGAREVAFHYIVLADFHSGLNTFGRSDNTSPITGTATSATSTTLTDSSGAFASVSVGGHGIKITGGMGAGQLRSVNNSNAVGGLFNTLVVNDPWVVIPDATSTYILFHGSGGRSKALLRPDGAFAASKNIEINLGGFSPLISGPFQFQASFVDTWKTILHEFGHSLSLMHGGTDHVNDKAGYVSIMNYAYQLCQPGQAAKTSAGAVIAGAAPCPVNSYSFASDAVHFNWGRLDHTVLNFRDVGQAFGATPSVPNPPLEEEPTKRDHELRYGPFDDQGPAVVISTPSSASVVAPGSAVAVAFSATDNTSVAAAEAMFDVNGNGQIDEATERFAATPAGGGNFVVNIPVVSGANGPRPLTVFAYDPRGNPGFAAILINVGAALPVTVPNVVGQTQAAASSAIVAAGLVAGTTTAQASATVPLGNVIAQNPAAGTPAAAGSAVNIVVSSGAAPPVTLPPVTLPVVAGQTQAAASSAIIAAGLTIGTITTQASSTVPAGTVISQNPAGGTSAAAGSAVNLVVSSGVAPVISVSGITPTGSGAILVTASGGGTNCGFTQHAFLPVSGGVGSPPPGTAPTGVAFPHGLFGFVLGPGCTSGSGVLLTVTYPQNVPFYAQYWKYGPTPANPTPHWYTIPATINGAQVTFTIADGGLGDDDLAANGSIVDAGGIGIGALPAALAPGVQIPTMHDGMLMVLALLLALMAWHHQSRRTSGAISSCRNPRQTRTRNQRAASACAAPR